MNQYEPSDAKIFYDVVAEIRRVIQHPFFDPARFAYRVTRAEYHAMRRHFEHQHGGTCVSLNILGVDVTPTMPESAAAVIKDYSGSG